MAFAVAAAVVVASLSGGRAARSQARAPARVRAPVGRGTTRHRARATADVHAIRRVLRSTSYIAVGSPRRREVALTFDDGPGPFTSRILRTLRHRHVPATFFVIGRNVAQRPPLVREEQRLGFAIGDHTEDHPFMARLAPAAQQAEIYGVPAALWRAGVRMMPLFRPPYGSFTASTLDVLRRAGMLMVLWTVDTRDFTRPGTRRIVYTALSGARAGAIILMHDGGPDRGQTAAALPRIIVGLQRHRFHLVTVPRLLRDDPPPAGQAPPRSLSGRG